MKILINPKVIKLFTILISISIVFLIYITYCTIKIRGENFTPQVPKADCIVVLGAAVWPGAKPSPVLADRLIRATELYKSGIAPKIICTGGVGKNPPSEAEVSKAFLIDQGISEKDILYENITTSTAEQAIEVKKICLQQGFKSIALVTSFFHQKRAIEIFKRVDFPATIFDARCTHTRYQDLNRWCIRESFFLAKLNSLRLITIGIGLGLILSFLRTQLKADKLNAAQRF